MNLKEHAYVTIHQNQARKTQVDRSLSDAIDMEFMTPRRGPRVVVHPERGNQCEYKRQKPNGDQNFPVRTASGNTYPLKGMENGYVFLDCQSNDVEYRRKPRKICHEVVRTTSFDKDFVLCAILAPVALAKNQNREIDHSYD